MKKVFLVSVLAICSSFVFGMDRTAFNGIYQYLPQYVSPNSATTVQITEKVQTLVINTGGTLTTLNVLLPVRPIDGQTCGISSTQIITNMSITATGKTVKNALTTFAAAGARQRFVFRQTDNTWYVF